MPWWGFPIKPVLYLINRMSHYPFRISIIQCQVQPLTDLCITEVAVYQLIDGYCFFIFKTFLTKRSYQLSLRLYIIVNLFHDF